LNDRKLFAQTLANVFQGMEPSFKRSIFKKLRFLLFFILRQELKTWENNYFYRPKDQISIFYTTGIYFFYFL